MHQLYQFNVTAGPEFEKKSTAIENKKFLTNFISTSKDQLYDISSVYEKRYVLNVRICQFLPRFKCSLKKVCLKYGKCQFHL